MRGLARAVVALVAMETAAFAGESVDNDGIWFCRTIQSSPTETLYVSDHFDGRFDLSEVPNAFKQMVATKYGANVQPSCSHAYRGPGILEKLESDNQRWYQQIRAGGGKVVETHWSFAPASERLTYVCSGGAQYAKNGARAYSFFYADAIDMPGSEQAKLGEAWDAYLTSLHPGWFFPAKGCNLVPAGQTVQSIVDAQAQTWKSQNAEMVHVDWKYAPVQNAASDDVPSEFCQALRMDNKFWYVSPVFPMASVEEANVAMNAWRTYVHGLKDPEGLVVGDSYLSGCDGPAKAKDINHQKAARAEQIKDGGGRVFETGWVPANAPSAAAATAAAAASAAVPKTYQCYMASFGGSYMTPGFQSAKDLSVLNADWRAYITKAHPAAGVVQIGCGKRRPNRRRPLLPPAIRASIGASDRQGSGPTRRPWSRRSTRTTRTRAGTRHRIERAASDP